jgi:hypothetical protein
MQQKNNIPVKNPFIRPDSSKWTTDSFLFRPEMPSLMTPAVNTTGNDSHLDDKSYIFKNLVYPGKSLLFPKGVDIKNQDNIAQEEHPKFNIKSMVNQTPVYPFMRNNYDISSRAQQQISSQMMSTPQSRVTTKRDVRNVSAIVTEDSSIKLPQPVRISDSYLHDPQIVQIPVKLPQHVSVKLPQHVPVKLPEVVPIKSPSQMLNNPPMHPINKACLEEFKQREIHPLFKGVGETNKIDVKTPNVDILKRDENIEEDKMNQQFKEEDMPNLKRSSSFSSKQFKPMPIIEESTPHKPVKKLSSPRGKVLPPGSLTRNKKDPLQESVEIGLSLPSAQKEDKCNDSTEVSRQNKCDDSPEGSRQNKCDDSPEGSRQCIIDPQLNNSGIIKEIYHRPHEKETKLDIIIPDHQKIIQEENTQCIIRDDKITEEIHRVQYEKEVKLDTIIPDHQKIETNTKLVISDYVPDQHVDTKSNIKNTTHIVDNMSESCNKEQNNNLPECIEVNTEIKANVETKADNVDNKESVPEKEMERPPLPCPQIPVKAPRVAPIPVPSPSGSDLQNHSKKSLAFSESLTLKEVSTEQQQDSPRVEEKISILKSPSTVLKSQKEILSKQLSIDDINTSLKVMGDLEKGKKLSIIDDRYVAEDSGLGMSITRYRGGQGRQRVIEFLDNMYVEVTRNSTEVLTDIRNGINIDNNLYILRGLIYNISIFLHNYDNMRHAYISDSSAYSQLSLTKDKFFMFLNTFFRDVIIPRSN